MYCNSFMIHLLMDICVISRFWLLQIRMLLTFMYKSLQEVMLSFIFRHIARSGMTRLYARYMFNLKKNCQTVSKSGCIILHSQQQCLRVYLLYILTIVYCLNCTHSKRYIEVSHCGLILISPMTKDVLISFQVGVCDQHIYFDKVCVQIFCFFFLLVFAF